MITIPLTPQDRDYIAKEIQQGNSGGVFGSSDGKELVGWELVASTPEQVEDWIDQLRDTD